MGKEVKLSDETIEKLSLLICKRFFQHIEKALIHGEETGLLGFLLKSYLTEIQAKQKSEEGRNDDREARLLNILANAPRDFYPVSVQEIKGKEIQKPTSWTKG